MLCNFGHLPRYRYTLHNGPARPIFSWRPTLGTGLPFRLQTKRAMAEALEGLRATHDFSHVSARRPRRPAFPAPRSREWLWQRRVI